MKNLIMYSGIALAVLANSDKTTFDSKKEVETSQKIKKEEVNTKKDFPNFYQLSKTNNATELESKDLFLRNFPKKTSKKAIEGEEPIVVFSVNKMNKTADALIVEDNAITENNLSNEIQALDFDLINRILAGYVVVESVTISKNEKTADALIAEDNAITENNLSNEIQALDFEVINRISAGYEVVESVTISKTERNADVLIAEDNAITENNLSNETQTLDFEIINKVSKS